MTPRFHHSWAQPLLSTTLWTLVLIDIAAMTVIENQPFFAAYVAWAWPSVVIAGVIGYFVGPSVDRLCGQLLARRKNSQRSV